MKLSRVVSLLVGMSVSFSVAPPASAGEMIVFAKRFVVPRSAVFVVFRPDGRGANAATAVDFTLAVDPIAQPLGGPGPLKLLVLCSDKFDADKARAAAVVVAAQIENTIEVDPVSVLHAAGFRGCQYFELPWFLR